MSWTDDRVTTLKKLWAEGQSASAIAAALGEVTRNAVIGKVHRLGLAGRRTAPRRPKSGAVLFPSSTRHPNARRPRTPSAFPRTRRPATSIKQVLCELGPAPDHPVTVETLTGRNCRWPEGDPKIPGFHFCGRPKTETPGPYCGAHAAIAYR
jgi:GcrA cell cycle regulator